MYDPTFELRRDDEADAAEWGDTIPFDGEVYPASDTAGMDAEVIPYEEWLEIYQFELAEATEKVR